MSGFDDLIERFANRRVGGKFFQNQFACSNDDGEEVIEIMGHTARQSPDAFHLLGLAKLSFPVG